MQHSRTTHTARTLWFCTTRSEAPGPHEINTHKVHQAAGSTMDVGAVTNGLGIRTPSSNTTDTHETKNE